MLKMLKAYQLSPKMIIGLMIIVLLGGWLPSRFAVTVTPSLKYRLFYINGFMCEDVIKAGDYVLFRTDKIITHNAQLFARTNTAIKQVACSEGAAMAVVDKDFYCNGMLLGKAKSKTRSGDLLNSFQFHGVIPAANYFLMGHHVDSFDSRYFGFVERASIIARVTPIF